MADQFENQLPQKSDAKWVRAVDASGNPILISKEDLASVVGELLGVSFVERQDITDPDTSFTGFVRLKSGTNAPENLPGILLSFFMDGVCAQFYFTGWPRKLYTRMNWDGWNNWVLIVNGL